jgi:hypothetical protein
MDSLLSELPAGVVLTRDAEAAGIDGAMLRRAVRDGGLTRLRPGAYVRTTEWSGASAERRHRLVVAAAARQLRDPVFWLESAAVVWGLPVVAHVGALHVLGGTGDAPGVHGSGTRGDVSRHAATDVRVVVHDGLRVSSPLDTVLAVAAARDLRSALPVADAAVRRGLVTPEALRAAAADRPATRGVRRARLVAALADGRSESPGESVSRARFHLDGFAQPRLQVPVRDRAGTFARVDFLWDDVRVVGEFDGRVKYRADGVDDTRRPEERVWAEKLREDRIRAGGVRVVRWTWREAWHPGPLAALLSRSGVPRRASGAETH